MQPDQTCKVQCTRVAASPSIRRCDVSHEIGPVARKRGADAGKNRLVGRWTGQRLRGRKYTRELHLASINSRFPVVRGTPENVHKYFQLILSRPFFTKQFVSIRNHNNAFPKWHPILIVDTFVECCPVVSFLPRTTITLISGVLVLHERIASHSESSVAITSWMPFPRKSLRSIAYLLRIGVNVE
jgi:hypothetical protein